MWGGGGLGNNRDKWNQTARERDSVAVMGIVADVRRNGVEVVPGVDNEAVAMRFGQNWCVVVVQRGPSRVASGQGMSRIDGI